MNCTGKRCIMQWDKVDPATCKCVSYCPQATPPITNADRIRAMSDEELAEFVAQQRFCTLNPIADKLGIDITPMFVKCRDIMLDWLRQEVKDA